MPHGNIHYDQVRSADRHGTAGQFQMFTGTSTASHIALFDANGNLIDGGAASTTTIVVETNTVAVGTRGGINLIAGANVTITGADNAGGNRVDVTIAASGTSTGGSGSPSGFQFFDGTSYYMQSPALTCTVPVAGNFSWVNQGGATEAASGGQLYLHGPDLDNTGVICRVASMGTKTTLVAAFVPIFWGGGAALANPNTGICFRESATGKLIVMAFGFDNQQPLAIAVQALAAPNTFTAEMVKQNVGRTFPYMVGKLQLSAGNVIFSYSFDGGANFVQLWSEAQTTHFTTGPDQWGYYVQPHSLYASSALTHFLTS